MLYSTVNMCWKPEVTTDMPVPSTVHCASLELPPIKRPVTSRRGGGGGLVKGDPNCEPPDALFTSFGISEISELLTKSSIPPLRAPVRPQPLNQDPSQEISRKWRLKAGRQQQVKVTTQLNSTATNPLATNLCWPLIGLIWTPTKCGLRHSSDDTVEGS